MGKRKQNTGKIEAKTTRNVQVNIKRMKSKDTKPKTQPLNKAKQLKQQKIEAEKAEKDRRIMQYKKKRLEKTKVISKKTSRGQPLMKNRIEYLLKQIQEMKKN